MSPPAIAGRPVPPAEIDITFTLTVEGTEFGSVEAVISTNGYWWDVERASGEGDGLTDMDIDDGLLGDPSFIAAVEDALAAELPDGAEMPRPLLSSAASRYEAPVYRFTLPPLEV